MTLTIQCSLRCKFRGAFGDDEEYLPIHIDFQAWASFQYEQGQGSLSSDLQKIFLPFVFKFGCAQGVDLGVFWEM